MILNKKASDGMSQFMSMVLAVVLIGLALYFAYLYFFAGKNATNQCPGICIEKGSTCTFPRTAQGYTCEVSGKKGLAGICCASIFELGNKQDGKAVPSTDTKNNIGTGKSPDTKSTDTKDTNTPPPASKNALQIRQGFLTKEVSTGSAINLESGKTSTYYFWGEGKDASTCAYNVIDKETSNLPDANTGMNLEKSGLKCGILETVKNQKEYIDKGDARIIKIDFKPTNKANGKYYEFDTYLKDSKGDIIQSARNTLAVSSK